MRAAQRSARFGAFGLLLAILCGGILGGCASREEKAEQHRERAEAHFAKREYKQALIELRAALQLQPTSAELNHAIASLFHLSGALSDATFYYSEAYRLDPSRSEDGLTVAALIRFADPEGAAQIVDQVLDSEPDNATAHVRRSEVLLVQGDLAGSLAAARKAVALAPESGGAWLNLGIVHQAQIRDVRHRPLRKDGLVQRPAPRREPDDALFESAVAAFERAARHAPTRRLASRAQLEQARVLASWGARPERANAAFREFVEESIAHDGRRRQQAAARVAVAHARSSGDRELQRWALEKLAEVDDGTSAWLELAALDDAAAGPGETGSGERTLRGLLADRRKSAEAHVTFARYLAGRGDGDAAVAHLESVEGDVDDGPVLLSALARIQFDLADAPGGAATLRRLERDYPDTLATQVALARHAIQEQRTADAIAILTRALEARDSWEIYHLMAMAQVQARDYAAATQAIERARELAPVPLVRLDRLNARIHHASRRWTDAWIALRDLRRRGVELGPGDRLMLAQALYEMQRDRAALQVLDSLLDEPDPAPQVALELARRESGRDPERVGAVLRSAHERHPAHPGLLTALTRLDVAAGHEQVALDRLNRVIQARAGDAPAAAILTRAQLLLRMGHPDPAERDLLALLEREPHFRPAARRLAALYGSQGRIDDAIRSFEQADSAGVSLGTSRVLLARLLLERGDVAKAQRELETALAEHADLPGAKNDLAYLLADQGQDLDRALQLVQDAYRVLDDDPNVIDTLGYVYLKRGLHRAAVAQFELAIDLARSAGQPDPLLHYHHGLALRALDRHHDAAAEFEAALALDRAFPEADAAREALEAARRALGNADRPATRSAGAS